MFEADIWLAANLMNEQHRGDARAYAEQKATELTADGDLLGHEKWLQIACAIDQLMRTTPDGQVH